MPDTYILPAHFDDVLDEIRKQFNETKQVVLKPGKKISKISLFFGETNVPKRHEQVLLLEEMAKALQNSKPVCDEDTSQATHLHYELKIKRVLVACMLYIKFRIDGTYIARSSKASVLVQLLDKALGLNNTTPAIEDETTLLCVLYDAKLFLGCYTRLDNIDARTLKKFKAFLNEETHLLTEKKISYYPITNIALPIISKSFAVIGHASKIALDTLSETTLVSSLKNPLISTLGDGICWFTGGSSQFGILVVTALMSNSPITLGLIVDKTFETTGYMLGLGTGVTLDLLYKGMKYLIKISSTHPHCPPVYGMNLITGERTVKGLTWEIQHEKELNTAPSLENIDVFNDPKQPLYTERQTPFY